MTPNDKLPKEITDQIKADATAAYPDVHGFVAYTKGATAYAPWKVKYDELQATIDDKIDKALHAERNAIQVKMTEMETGYLKQIQRMADALEWIKTYGPCDATTIAFINKALSEWKDGKGDTTKEKNTMENKESTASYTKGEWYLQEYTDAYTNIVRCNNGKGHESLFIAYTAQSSLPEARANAQLMSAAPDLLEALQGVIAISDRDHVAWTKARVAIDKAIGSLQQFKDGKGKEVGNAPNVSEAFNPDQMIICVECKTKPAITDYNGNGYYVCKSCDDKLNREFDNEYQ